MNLAKPNKLIEYLTDGKRNWILYSHSGWENTILAEMNASTKRITSIICGVEMKNRDKIAKLQFSTSIKKVPADTSNIGFVLEAYYALSHFVESNPANELGRLLLLHCDSENFVIDTDGFFSDFSRGLKGDEIVDLLDIFRRVNIEGAGPEECACGVCCDLDTQIMELENEGVLNAESHGNAIGVIGDTFDDAVKATELLKDKGYSVLPMADYPDKYRNFVTYILKM